MRKLIGIAAIFIIFCSHGFAGNSGSASAKEITVQTISKEMSRGKQTGIKIDIFQASKKDVASEWAKVIRQNTRSKAEERDNEIYIIGTHIPSISTSPLNIYAIVNDHLDYIEVIAFFETPDGFITQEKSETAFLSCRKFLRDFGVVAYKEAVKDEKKGEEKKLNALKSDLKSIVNTNDKLHKNIAKEERSILQARSDIKSTELEEERLRSEIHINKSRLYNIRGEEAKKEAEKEIKELEKKLSAMKKKIESLHKDIVKSEADIRSYQREIGNNNTMVTRKQGEIDRQTDVIYRVEQKLMAIR